MYTSLDVFDYLLSTTGGGAQDQEHRALRQALFNAYRDLVTAREWRWHHTVDTVDLEPTELVTTYTLPWGCQSVDALHLTYPMVTAEYITPMEWERLVRSQLRQLARLVWTVLPSHDTPDRYDVKILNGYKYCQQATITYRRRPRDLKCTGWEQSSRVGTLDWNGKQVTGTGTAFSPQAVGCVLRVSGDPKRAPESLAGMAPYRDEGLIYRVDNAVQLQTWTPAVNVSYTGTRYCITDYLDISPGMYTALLSGCELWLARILGKNIDGPAGVYGRDLRMAFESDAVAPLSGRRSSLGAYYQFWYLRPGVDQGGGGGGTGGPNADGPCEIPPPIYGGDSSTDFTDCGHGS